jgi:hypothetical protein
MRATQTVKHPESAPRAGRRQRRAGISLLIFGVIVVVAAFAPTSANAVVPNSALVPAGPATADLSCTGNNDPTTDAILAGTVGNPVILGAKFTTNAIESPDDGEAFTLDFTWTFTLPQSLVSVAVATTPNLVQSNGVLPIHADSGATGADAVGNPPDTTVDLGDGTQAVSYNAGPFSATFTRAGAVGTPVQFSPGTITTDSVAGGITLHLLCTPQNVVPLVLNDQAGPPPPPTTAKPPATPPPATTAPAGPVVAAETTTSQSSLARTGFHSELLYLGIALLGAGYALSLTGRRVAKQARSR